MAGERAWRCAERRRRPAWRRGTFGIDVNVVRKATGTCERTGPLGHDAAAAASSGWIRHAPCHLGGVRLDVLDLIIPTRSHGGAAAALCCGAGCRRRRHELFFFYGSVGAMEQPAELRSLAKQGGAQ